MSSPDKVTQLHLYLYGPDQGPLETSFEAAESRLNRLANLYFEPDGSFVWARDGGKQQLFGMLYDAAGKIQYCELRGQCDLATWQSICFAITNGETAGVAVLKLPVQQMQDLQSFENSQWPR